MENGKKKADLCWEFGLVHAMIQMFWKNRTNISVFEQNGSRVQWFRKPEQNDIE
jgi:hypothetical protein